MVDSRTAMGSSQHHLNTSRVARFSGSRFTPVGAVRSRKSRIPSSLVRNQLDSPYSGQSFPAGRDSQSDEYQSHRRGRSRSPRDSPGREQRHGGDQPHYYRGRSTEVLDHRSSARDGRHRRRSRSPSLRERSRSRSRSRSNYRSSHRRDDRSRSPSRARSPRQE